jgi:hypothetical protein
MSGNFEKFLSHLDKSHDGVWLVANYLSRKGYNITINTTTKAKSAKDWRKHADSGDLYITQRIEVKSLSTTFTCRNDWPYNETMIVCAKHSYDEAIPKPYAYVLLNKEKTHMAIIMADTHKYWKAEERTDKRYENYSQLFYFCPLDCVIFSEINYEF